MTAKNSDMIYVVGTKETPQRVKIGYTQQVTTRLGSLECGALGFRLYLFGLVHGDRNDERTLHDNFSEHRIYREWFWFHDDVRKWLKVYHWWKSDEGVHVASPFLAQIAKPLASQYNQEVLSLSEAGRIVGRSSPTIRRWIDQGLLEYVTEPTGLLKVRRSALEKFGRCDR